MRVLVHFCVCSVFCMVCACQAQENCEAEVKLLLLPSNTQSAVRVFNAGTGMPGQVYFFDTSTLDLLSHGVIVRLRRSATADLTIKLRPTTDKKIVHMSNGNYRHKCEFDLTGGIAVRSYSIQTKVKGMVPETGDEVFALLNPAQKQLLKQADVSIDWARVKRIADIKSTDWRIIGQAPFPKLALELWEWSTGEVLELSTKVAADTASSAYSQLKQLAGTKGLSLSSIQTPKTVSALESIVHAT